MTDFNDPLDKITSRIIGAAIEVHRHIGAGLLESAYRACLAFQLIQDGVRIECERPLPLTYRGSRLDCGYRLDFVVEDAIIVEVKAIERFAPIHTAQMLSYLRISGLRVGLLINFNVVVLRQGIRRIVNGFA